MFLLGLLIGGPSTLFILSGFRRPLRSAHDRAGYVRPKPELHGPVEHAGYGAGTIAGFLFWAAVLFGPLIWLFSQ